MTQSLCCKSSERDKGHADMFNNLEQIYNFNSILV